MLSQSRRASSEEVLAVLSEIKSLAEEEKKAKEAVKA